MNRKQLVILLVFALALGGAGLVLLKRQKTSWVSGSPDTAAGGKLLGDLPVNDIRHIAIRQDTNEVNLAKKDDLWVVRERNDYPASFPQISELILKLRDLKIVQNETVGPSQLPRLQLATGQGTNSAMTMEFKGENDKTIKTLLLGKKHMKKAPGGSPMEGGDEGWPDGRYVKLADSGSVALISDPLDSIEPLPATWLSKDFIKVERPRSVAVTSPDATNSWTLTRESETAQWILADAKPDEQLDTIKISAVTSPLATPTFTDVMAGGKLASSGTNQPSVVSIKTFDGFSYAVTVGERTNDDYVVSISVTAEVSKARVPEKDEKPEDKARLDKEFADKQQKLADKVKWEQTVAGWNYLVPSWSIDPLLRQRAQLLVGDKEDAQGLKSPGESGATPGAVPAVVPPN